MFAFVGAHLGRQFEFVQSEWINGGDFLGLGDVKDPIAGAARRAPARIRSRGGRFPSACEACRGSSSRAAASTASCPACARCAGSPSFGHEARRRVDVLVVGGGPAGLLAALRAGDLGAQHRAGHARRVRRHGRPRRAGSGADAGARGPAAPRRAAARSVRHRRGRAGAGLPAAARARARGGRRRARPRGVARADRRRGRHRPRATPAPRASWTRTPSRRRAGCAFAPRRSSSARAASAGGSRSPDSS